ncbi:hypothetical protein FA13DRAFT_1131279 [Coprinellus micaceus]|uniref:Uncharacterized protein n=1 Tax=Coprinellus micaceus TaxID=71717 RepID=A0A4Y7SW05_COPMI|nr:hypothetical protein FA13DRAFT_1131279 [Coprinellus micaceus]
MHYWVILWTAPLGAVSGTLGLRLLYICSDIVDYSLGQGQASFLRLLYVPLMASRLSLRHSSDASSALSWFLVFCIYVSPPLYLSIAVCLRIYLSISLPCSSYHLPLVSLSASSLLYHVA